jgi:hypothetical protein
MKPDRSTADMATRRAMQQKEAALRQKKADCGRQAKARKLYFHKRARFVAECMAR